jgi:hypothetical protein
MNAETHPDVESGPIRTRAGAAEYLKVSLSTFDRYVRPCIPRLVVTPSTIRYHVDDLAEASAPKKPRRRMKVDENILPTLALDSIMVTREQAAACLGMSPESFDEHVRPTLRQVPVSSRLVLFRPETLRAWVERREADPPRD